MKFLRALIPAIPLVFSTSVHATSLSKIISKLGQKYDIALVHKKNTRATAGDFVDFSGTWEGRCNGEDRSQMVEIENGPDFLEMDDYMVWLNSSESATENTPYNSEQWYGWFNWSQDKKSIIIVTHEIGSLADAHPAQMEHSISKILLRMEGKALVMEEDNGFIASNEEGGLEVTKTICRFNRQ